MCSVSQSTNNTHPSIHSLIHQHHQLQYSGEQPPVTCWSITFHNLICNWARSKATYSAHHDIESHRQLRSAAEAMQRQRQVTPQCFDGLQTQPHHRDPQAVARSMMHSSHCHTAPRASESSRAARRGPAPSPRTARST